MIVNCLQAVKLARPKLEEDVVNAIKEGE